MTKKGKDFDLEERLIDFAVRIIQIADRRIKLIIHIRFPSGRRQWYRLPACHHFSTGPSG